MKLISLKSSNKIFQNGFTLIELLVTISIVVIFLVVSLPVFQDYRYRNDLSRAADLIQSGIYETRNLALAPRVDKSKDSQYYAIKINSNSNNYEIYETPNTNGISGGLLVGSYQIPSNCLFIIPSKYGSEIIIYYSIKNLAKIEKPNEDIFFDISHRKISQLKKIIDVNYITGQVFIK